MAERPEDLLVCRVCLEEYEGSGPHIPRILPCSHTVCEWCVIQLLGGGGTLKCPECRARHAAPRREKTFPQNKYLLTLIKLRDAESSGSEEESDEEVKRCPDHGKELTLFCKETQCQTLICTVCMTRKHKKHDVVDVDENRKEELLTRLTSAIESLSFKKNQIKIVQKKNEKSLSKLKEDKRTILNLVRDKYDSMIQEAENQKKESRSKMTSLQESLIVLNDLKQQLNRETISAKQVKNCQETVDSVVEHNDLAPLEVYYMEYTENRDKDRLVQELCGELSRRSHNIKLPVKQDISGSFIKQTQEIGAYLVKPFQQIEKNVPAASQHVEQPERIRRCEGLLKKTWQTDVLTNSSRLHYSPKFTLKRSFETRYRTDGSLYLSAAGRDSVFVCGRDTNSRHYSVTHYNLVTGEERCTVRLDDAPSGMTTVLYDNRLCIAVAYWLGMQINSRPVDDLKQVVHRLHVIPHRPSNICAVTSSLSQLLYCDDKTDKIHRVDCSTAPPTPRGEIPIAHDGQNYMYTMCTSGDLLVVARGGYGVFAHTLDGGELKWKVSGKLPGMEHEIKACRVAAGKQGHLFVYDIMNKCVHVLSARDGTHLGVVVREGQDGVGIPCKVAWHSESASLSAVHWKDKAYHLSVFSGQN